MGANGLSLESLFRACDVNDTGFIGREELRDLCADFGITEGDSNAIFDDLDYDKDGKINFEDFCKGFKDFSPSTNFSEQQKPLKHGPRNKVDQKTSRKLSRQAESYSYGSSVMEVNNTFETMLTSVMKDIRVLQEENQRLREEQEREKTEHARQMRALEEDIDKHVAKVEERVRMETIDAKAKQDKKLLKLQLNQEMNELQAHMQLFQKVDDWLTKRQPQSVSKEPEAILQAQDLQSDVLGLSTRLETVKADVDKLKTFYDDKADSGSGQSSLQDEASQECMLKQYRLLHDTNERMKHRKESLKQLVGQNDPDALKHLSESVRSHRNNAYSRSDSQSSEATGKKYVLRRLLNDVDSGISTNEMDLGNVKSKDREAFTHSGDFSLTSLGSDSKPSTMDKHIDDDMDESLDEEPLVQDSQFFVREFPYSSLRKKRMSSTTRRSFRSKKAASTVSDVICPPDRTYKVVFGGDAAVGKTSFILRVCEDLFVQNISSTLGVDFHVKMLELDDKAIALQLWDTAGQERFRSITQTYFRRADGVLLLYDITNESSFLSIRSWIETIREFSTRKTPVILCGNKVDLRDALKSGFSRVVTHDQGEKLARENDLIFIETSNKSGLNVTAALCQLARQMTLNEDVEIQSSLIALDRSSMRKKSCCQK